MAGGYSVNLSALTNAGNGAAALMQDLDQHSVKDIACEDSAVGHDRLSSAIGSFCDRWDIGVKNLSKDGKQLAQNLLDNAAGYQAAEQQCIDLLSRAVNSGPGTASDG